MSATAAVLPRSCLGRATGLYSGQHLWLIAEWEPTGPALFYYFEAAAPADTSVRWTDGSGEGPEPAKGVMTRELTGVDV